MGFYINTSEIKEVKQIRIWKDNTLNYVILEMIDGDRYKILGHEMSDDLKEYINKIIRDEKIKSLL